MKKIDKRVFVGFDGFIDNISSVVEKRHSTGIAFEKVQTIDRFAEIVKRSAGKSANIELYLNRRKLGGNGPLLANGLAATGVDVKYIGLLGEPIDDIFKTFAKRTNAISVGSPGETHALEFEDGKIMLCYTSPVEQLTYEKIVSVVGEEEYGNSLQSSDILVFENWTMLINLTDILQKTFYGNIGKRLQNSRKILFFDMADPAKRKKFDVLQFLELLKNIKIFGDVYLSLNRSETEYISDILETKLPSLSDNNSDFSVEFEKLRERLGISGLICHFAGGAFFAGSRGSAFHKSHTVDKISCLTGSGDNFNAGFIFGLINNRNAIDTLKTAHAFAAAYISNGEISSISEVDKFMSQTEI